MTLHRMLLTLLGTCFAFHQAESQNTKHTIETPVTSTILATTPTNNAIDHLDWKLTKEKANIQIYTAKVPKSPHKAVLSISIFKSSLHKLTALLRDTTTCKQWVHRCKHSYIYKSVGNNEEYIYTANTMPFLAKNRDILAHLVWQQDPKTLTVTGTAAATYNILNENRQYIRITEAKMIWELTPIKDGYIQVRNFTHLNPAGGIPSWMSNQLIFDIPFKTMKALKHVLENYKPHKAKIFMEPDL